MTKAVKVFALSVGTTALCMLGCVGAFPEKAEPVALEASVFNGNQGFPSGQAQTAQGTGEKEPEKVIPLGTVFGMKLFTDGVIVASLSDIFQSFHRGTRSLT